MRKTKFISILLIVLLLANCINTRNEDLKIRESLTYDLINTILNDSTEPYLDKKNILISEIDLLGPPVMGDVNDELQFIMNLLGEKDSIYIKIQFKFRREFRIDVTRIGLKEVLSKEYFEKGKVPRDSMWNHVFEKTNDGFTSISMPIFSSDNELAYIRLGQFCGDHCGEGESRLYRYKDGKWEKIKTFSHWIS